MKNTGTWAASAPKDGERQAQNPAWVAFAGIVRLTVGGLEARHVDANRGAAGHECLLNGLISCPLCGARMICAENQRGEQISGQLWSFAPCRLRCSQSEASAKSCPMTCFSGADAERFILRAVELEVNFGQHGREVLAAYGHTDFFDPIEHQALSAEVATLNAEEVVVGNAMIEAMMADKPGEPFQPEMRRISQHRREIKARIATLEEWKRGEALTLSRAERHTAAFLHDLAITDGRRNEALTKIIDRIVPQERAGGGWAYEVAFRSTSLHQPAQ